MHSLLAYFPPEKNKTHLKSVRIPARLLLNLTKNLTA